MSKNPIFRKERELNTTPCGNVFEEITENSQAMDTINGAGWKETIVCTITQGTIGCIASYAIGNSGYCCTYSKECTKCC